MGRPRKPVELIPVQRTVRLSKAAFAVARQTAQDSGITVNAVMQNTLEQAFSPQRKDDLAWEAGYVAGIAKSPSGYRYRYTTWR